ncbi:MAG: lysylphosphatidylglycerol synthase transmembrane domain-containing protein [Acidobacteriota bacterium]|nr:lysylphosphatidylglycerol synthase transmembrane domain-containing protein [Acidobacteriota bacterium]
MWRRIVSWVSGPLLAAFFLWLCLRGVSLHDLGTQVRGAHPLWLAFSALTVVVHLILRSWRWRTLLRSVRAKIPYRELLSATSIGYMASLLPGRVGEVLRPALLARRADLPFPPALATVGVERAVLDLLAVLAFGAAALVLPAGVSGLSAGADPLLLARLRVAGGAVLAGALVALVLTMLLARHRESVGAWLETRRQTMGRLPRLVTGWLASLLPGLATFSTMRGALRLAWETLLVWLVIGVGIQAGIHSTGVAVPPGAFLLMLPILAAGIGIPTPGGTGTYHLAMMLGLSKLFGVDEAAALGAGVVVHAVTWLPVLAMGGGFIVAGGLGRRDGGRGPADASGAVAP